MPSQIKLYVEIFGALLLAALVAWFIHTQREKGRDEIRAANAQAQAGAIVHQAEVESRAQTLADQSLARYKNSLGATPPRDALTVRVCKPASGAPVAQYRASDVGPRPVADDGRGLQGGVEEGNDIGPVTEQILARATAKVIALQGYVQACIDAGICKKVEDASP